ncbi:MAG: UDP-N-acetylmuramoyl-L-alanyl-D-glutamate--2,6-diaminopimelate ligase [Actinobacteria bacterium]|nr:UDP-N-acetylmuramoyl-L-alanyl-D-glutamate--2,6-diaminopimelate ligase [Actinomycetota bacterium]
MPGSRLEDLARLVDGRVETVDAGLVVSDVTHDSRSVVPGALFVAVVGSTRDGHDHVRQAADLGAVAACVERRLDIDLPQMLVSSTRAAMGPLAAAVHGDPSHHMTVVGVTGTNGKTTVSQYVTAIADHAGLTTGLIGTIETRIAGRVVESVRTTPEASNLQRLLAEMRASGCTLVTTEVSSHALTLGRVRATVFSVAAFTNLSQDHLDFHGTMEDYAAAKESLFTDYQVGTAVINVDDPTGARIAARVEHGLVTIGRDGMARAEDVRPVPEGSVFRMVTPWGSTTVATPVFGRFNVDNVVMAATCALAAGVGWPEVVSSLGNLPGVPGRFEKVSGDDPVTVIVDYAHTPAGIAQAIETARGLGGSRVIVVVGAGGDRDREKRPLMGRAAMAADVVVITSDNPRSEDPARIVDAVASGTGGGARAIIDRREAMRAALETARPGDIVLILGRGHESNQQVGDRSIPFDDRVVAVEELTAMRRSANSGSGTGSMVG